MENVMSDYYWALHSPFSDVLQWGQLGRLHYFHKFAFPENGVTKQILTLTVAKRKGVHITRISTIEMLNKRISSEYYNIWSESFHSAIRICIQIPGICK